MNSTPPFVQTEPLRDLQPSVGDVLRSCPPTAHPAAVKQAAGPAKHSLNVLCIDDDEQILESLKDCLGHFGHRVRGASGGKYGIELFCTSILKSEPYDVVIVDLSMPDLNGCDVAQQIKAESPRTPIIMVTGEDTNAKETGLTSKSVAAVVYKPVHMHELNNLLLQVTKRA